MSAAPTPPAAPRKPRHEWMDIARGAAVLLVILVHAGSTYADAGFALPEWIRRVGLAMAPYRMPLLIFLSGFLLSRSMDKGLFAFGYGKIRNILWPYLLWTVLFCLAAGQPGLLLTHSPWVGGTYLWYMCFLLVFFAAAVLVARVPLLVVASYAFAVSILAPDGSKFGERLFVLGAFFFCGAFAGRFLTQFTAMLADRRTLALAPLVIGLSAYSSQYGPINYRPFYGVIILPCIVGLCAILYHAQRFAATNLLKYVGRKSIVFYVVHMPVYVLLLRLLAAGGVTEPYLVIGSMLLAGLSAAVVLAVLSERHSAVDALFALPDVLGVARRPAGRLQRLVDALPLLPRPAAGSPPREA